MQHSSSDLFNYTSGRWLVNDALRHAERRLIFDVEGLCQLAAQSVGRSPADVINFSKLAEGGFNRTFLITLRDGFQMVARIPYPVTVPKYYAVASEVATMDFLRSSGLPVPQVYGYSPTSENAAKTEYIIMEWMKGTKLSDVWLELGDSDIVSILHQLAQLESQMMSISFPASGSLYYSHDLEKVSGRATIPLKDERFCVGPDTRLTLWYGRRSQLNVDRGPYKSAEAVLVGAAHKELAYLEQFGQPLLPFQRLRREGYGYKEQSPSDHIANLNHYLLIVLSLIPKNPTLRGFHIRHPDLQQSNIFVSKSPESGWQVVGLLDWQHTSILPLFLLAGIPDRLQNAEDQTSQPLMPPSLPENLGELNESEQIQAKEFYRRRLVHYQYVKNTAECNELHYAALTDPAGMSLRRLFYLAGDPWEGETLALKVALIEATEETMKLDAVQRESDKTFQLLQAMVGFESEGWVFTTHYDEAMARSKQLKENALAVAASVEEQDEIMTHWFLDNIDETNYM
ncbi:protein kinase subdomain-containing protein PKL/CAK/Fmp29 [Fomitiporia mediterranea MF3/22]|uniref:protein kinase subdomain-containing protein PKL/CAK/Fmp29 n=1 Tax=Fomitiporia mediterranea (strain MF3/22) TaxID=694068 RepID=UPI00044077C3|nr:protein kinase subdomain-containing protein PKL/CAK/Fmp29 [Fomitiporia mediterranea MF3/22]EJD08141.1 protein kinase subdomain-containing protein PKL/CAK/Fmp29 [Fomitiporia mediterranea MF3/22]